MQVLKLLLLSATAGMLPVAAVAAQIDATAHGDIDLADHAAFSRCLTGSRLLPACRPADLDADGDVDLADFAEFQIVFTGSM